MTPIQTAQQIANQIVAEHENQFGTVVPLLRGFVRKFAKTVGQKYVTLFKYGASIQLQQLIRTASNKPMQIGSLTITPLKEWGNLVEIYEKMGQRAERTVNVDVITQSGSLTSGEIIVNADNQRVYQVVGDVALDAAQVQVVIRDTRVGAAGNVDEGTTLYFRNAPDEVEKAVTVSAPVGTEKTGTDPEGTEVFRERILERWMARPQGGAMADYKHWGEELEEARNAYPYSGWYDPEIPDSHAGQVFVFVEASDTVDGIAGPLVIAAVEAHIEKNESGLANRRNINAEVRVFTISRTVFNVEIGGLAMESSTTAARAAIQSGVADFMLKRDPGGMAGYTTLLPRKDIVSNLEVGAVASRIAAAYGGTINGVTLRVDGAIVPAYPLQEGEKAKLGLMTWA